MMSEMMKANLFKDAAALAKDQTPQEITDILCASESHRIERIVSTGQCSPPEFWYDQPENEWVVVLRGSAVLRIEGENDLVKMDPGDYLLIPAHQRHRVEWTSPDQPTIWLAVFFTAESPAPSLTATR